MSEWRFNFQDLSGRRFHRLLVIERAPSITYTNGNSATRWHCICECGQSRIVYAGGLKSGKIKSCGCLNRESARQLLSTHGQSRTATYRTWLSMRSRCNDPRNKNYHRYGGRGVSVCESWTKSFETFLHDMGQRPKGCSLDRFPNKNGNYEKRNCRWATPKQQSRNTRTNRIITIGQISLSVSEWSEITGANRNTIYGRLHRGISPSEAIK